MAQINKPSEYFNTKLYTGTNTSTSITAVNFQPDLVWFKRRDSAAGHSLFDSVRGVTKRLGSDSTNAETTISDALTSFDSDGFTLGVDSGNYINFNTATYASWSWLGANGTVSNTDGSITSTVSANTTAGFSIVSYTGTGSNATVGHGLGSAPKVIIAKRLNTTQNWLAYHSTQGATKGFNFNTTDAVITDSGYWGNTEPTSSVFTAGTYHNGSYVAYCFAEKKGFSKFSSYTGNGNADGTFIYTGFKPAMVIIKKSSVAGENWNIYDNKRNTYNATDKALFADTDGAEATKTGGMDFVSNGIKIRGTDGAFNASGATYIYMAFASEPLTGTNGVPCTAR